jgi:hypothetical protein
MIPNGCAKPIPIVRSVRTAKPATAARRDTRARPAMRPTKAPVGARGTDRGGSRLWPMRSHHPRDPHNDPPPPRRRAPKPPGPIPTLRELREGTPWVWLHCEGMTCSHKSPMALVPLMIRWGQDASSDMLRQSARCTICGRKGTKLQHPSWGGSDVGFQPFPTDD